jgi:uncharacterized protein
MEKQPDIKISVPDRTLQRWLKEDADIQNIIAAHNANRQNDVRTLAEMNDVPETAYVVLQKDGKHIFVYLELPGEEAPDVANDVPEVATKNE